MEEREYLLCLYFVPLIIEDSVQLYEIKCRNRVGRRLRPIVLGSEYFRWLKSDYNETENKYLFLDPHYYGLVMWRVIKIASSLLVPEEIVLPLLQLHSESEVSYISS